VNDNRQQQLHLNRKSKEEAKSMPKGLDEQSTSLAVAKVLIAAASPIGAATLGAAVSGPCTQERYNRAASAALANPESGLSEEERRLIASFVAAPGPSAQKVRDYLLRVRLTDEERARLDTLAAAARMDISQYTRARLFGGEGTRTTPT